MYVRATGDSLSYIAILYMAKLVGSSKCPPDFRLSCRVNAKMGIIKGTFPNQQRRTLDYAYSAVKSHGLKISLNLFTSSVSSRMG